MPVEVAFYQVRSGIGRSASRSAMDVEVAEVPVEVPFYEVGSRVAELPVEVALFQVRRKSIAVV